MAEEILRERLREEVEGLSHEEEDELLNLINRLIELSILREKRRCKELVLEFIESSGGKFRGHFR